MVKDKVDSAGVEGTRITVDFHEKIDGPVVLVVCSGVPDPGREVGRGLEGDGVLAFSETGFDDPVNL